MLVAARDACLANDLAVFGGKRLESSFKFHFWLHCFGCKSTEQKEATANLMKSLARQSTGDVWSWLTSLIVL